MAKLSAYENGTEELEYELNSDKKSYRVTGVSDCSLTSIKIPAVYKDLYVTSIGVEAFSECEELESITIPNSIIEIENIAFEGCENLQTVFFDGDIEDWCKINFGKYDTNPMYYAETLYLRSGICDEIIIPETVTEIKANAFCGFRVKKISLPKSVASIDSNAFWCCKADGVYYNGSLAEWCNISFDSNPLECAHNLYIHNQLIVDLVIPNTVSTIKDRAFCGLNIRSVVIPKSVKAIGEDAFIDCHKLETIKYEGTVAMWYKIAEGSLTHSHFAHPILICSDGEVKFS